MSANRLALAGWAIVLFAIIRMLITQWRWEGLVVITLVASGACWVAALSRAKHEPSRVGSRLAVAGLVTLAVSVVVGAGLVYVVATSLRISG